MENVIFKMILIGNNPYIKNMIYFSILYEYNCINYICDNYSYCLLNNSSVLIIIHNQDNIDDTYNEISVINDNTNFWINCYDIEYGINIDLKMIENFCTYKNDFLTQIIICSQEIYVNNYSNILIQNNKYNIKNTLIILRINSKLILEKIGNTILRQCHITYLETPKY